MQHSTVSDSCPVSGKLLLAQELPGASDQDV